jgi:hypothetical protein
MKGLYCTLRSCALAMPPRHIKSASIKVHLLFCIPFIIFMRLLRRRCFMKTQNYAFYCILPLRSGRKSFDKVPTLSISKSRGVGFVKIFRIFRGHNSLKNHHTVSRSKIRDSQRVKIRSFYLKIIKSQVFFQVFYKK